MLPHRILSTLTTVTPDDMINETYYYIVSKNRLGTSVSNSVYKFYLGKFIEKIIIRGRIRYYFTDFGEVSVEDNTRLQYITRDDRTIVRIKLDCDDNLYTIDNPILLPS